MPERTLSRVRFHPLSPKGCLLFMAVRYSARSSQTEIDPRELFVQCHALRICPGPQMIYCQVFRLWPFLCFETCAEKQKHEKSCGYSYFLFGTWDFCCFKIIIINNYSIISVQMPTVYVNDTSRESTPIKAAKILPSS